jgi:galactitol 2-dehydrogenase
MRLNGKSAIITGGARGIGSAIAAGFAAQGARICIADIEFKEAQKTAKKIANGSIAFNLNVALAESIEACVQEAEKTFGGIDILVNAAAVFDLAPFPETTEESYDRVFSVNVKGTLFMMTAVSRSMIARGLGGKIINFSSQAGRRGEPLVAVYCASKAAVISLTQSAGLALIKHGINVNGISPGVVDTPMWDHVDRLFAKYESRPIGEKKRLVGEGVPFGRMGRPEDLVGCAVFLASSESDYIVAQTFNVDGGQWMS